MSTGNGDIIRALIETLRCYCSCPILLDGLQERLSADKIWGHQLDGSLLFGGQCCSVGISPALLGTAASAQSMLWRLHRFPNVCAGAYPAPLSHIFQHESLPQTEMIGCTRWQLRTDDVSTVPERELSALEQPSHFRCSERVSRVLPWEIRLCETL